MRKFGLSFSLRRAIGISGLSNRFSRRMGFPLTRSGRQRMVGREMGCCLMLGIWVFAAVATIALQFI